MPSETRTAGEPPRARPPPRKRAASMPATGAANAIARSSCCWRPGSAGPLSSANN